MLPALLLEGAARESCVRPNQQTSLTQQGAFACPLGDSCTMAHHIYEMWLHPLRFRSELCRKGPTCDRTICFFAHK